MNREVSASRKTGRCQQALKIDRPLQTPDRRGHTSLVTAR
jgi:hypothetical protein